MAVDFATFLSVVPHVINARYPVLLRGRHGIGKSEVVYMLGRNLSLPIVERRASQMTEGDLLGLPSTDGAVTTWNPPAWFKTACDEAVVLFLDEVDRATPEVRQGIFELTDSRKLAGFTLHPDTIIVAAVNGGEHGSQYQVGEMDPAELDRYTVFDVEPSCEDWLAWAKTNVDTVVWDFINQNRNHLEHTGDYEPNKVYPSRRSWHRFNSAAVGATLLEEGADAGVLFNLGAAFIGFEAAVAFQDFFVNYKRQVTVEDILVAGDIDKTSEFTINDHSALVEKMEAVEVFSDHLPSDQIQNLANYFVTLPSEVAMKLWTVLGNGEVQNTVDLHQSTAASGQSVSAYLVELLTGESA
jgi:hypothetical protein